MQMAFGSAGGAPDSDATRLDPVPLALQHIEESKQPIRHVWNREQLRDPAIFNSEVLTGWQHRLMSAASELNLFVFQNPQFWVWCFEQVMD